MPNENNPPNAATGLDREQKLIRALSRLSSILTVMNTGAHPDDEQSGMLAALRFDQGFRVVIACSTRGEGGQNNLGPERGAALAALRTRELEEAALVLDADISWLGHGPEDLVHDFGFSKNGDDTLARWGETRILERVVRAYREEKPDIVIPTFLDVPGQHGHHRAMTRAAQEAVKLAANATAFPEHFAEGLVPWQVSKLYLPAWSGAGMAYDDELPPPNATVAVRSSNPDAATGVSFRQLGEWSRARHASQGMGNFPIDDPDDWPLHLLIDAQGKTADETTIADGLARRLDDLPLFFALPEPLAAKLSETQRLIDEAVAAAPHYDLVLAAAQAAATSLEEARALLPDALAEAISHKLARKSRELDQVQLLAAAIEPHASLEQPWLRPGDVTGLIISGVPEEFEVKVVARDPGIIVHEPALSCGTHRFEISIAPDAPYTSPYPPGYAASGGNGALSLIFSGRVGERVVSAALDLQRPLQVVPAHGLALTPDAFILKRSAPTEAIDIRVDHDGGVVAFDAPDGWSAQQEGDQWTFVPPQNLAPGRHAIVPTVDGRAAYRKSELHYDHTGPALFAAPEILRVLSLDINLPEGVRVGYVGGGADRVNVWLSRLGIDVVALDAAALAGDLSQYSTILVGLFAFGVRQDLVAAREKIHRWVQAGGHLVTLYHRPWDGWSAEATAPGLLEIGVPSLRWRITNPQAPVVLLQPDHPLFAGPNRIDETDFDGWNKERGLYFAARWDERYQPLLSITDPGEKPLQGSLLSGQFGAGRHTHVALVLHHQLDHLVPGAFRLLANLVQSA